MSGWIGVKPGRFNQLADLIGTSDMLGENIGVETTLGTDCLLWPEVEDS